MVAYRKLDDPEETVSASETDAPSNFNGSNDSSFRRSAQRFGRPRRQALSHDLFHGLTPEEFNQEARSLAQAEAMTPEVRERLRTQLVERLKTPVDKPTWGPDWVRHGERYAPSRSGERKGIFGLFGKKGDEDAADDEPVLSATEQDDAHVIARNMEKSRQVHHYRWLYIGAAVLAIVIACLAMFVDYQIIRGDVWTRALANEFMVVPAALQSTLLFKSMQVIFAVLIVHFFLKITGVYGRNTLVAAAFVLSLVMIGCLGYLVAYNNMLGGTSATLEHTQDGTQATGGGNNIDQLFSASNAGTQDAQSPRVVSASMPGAATSKGGEFSLGLPKISDKSLANADSWFWLAFASVIFFIVTVVAALYMQATENNVRNVAISRDYSNRKRQFAQLHLLELADQEQGRATSHVT